MNFELNRFSGTQAQNSLSSALNWLEWSLFNGLFGFNCKSGTELFEVRTELFKWNLFSQIRSNDKGPAVKGAMTPETNVNIFFKLLCPSSWCPAGVLFVVQKCTFFITNFITKKSQEQITNFLPTNCPSLTLNEVLSIKFIQRVSN